MRTRQRKTKIIATYGPASSDEDTLLEMIEAGVDCIRINLAYGNEEEHRGIIELIRRVSRDRHIAIMVDIPGPKLRLKLSHPVRLRKGETLTIAEEGECRIDENIPFARLCEGQRILIKDGRFCLRIEMVGKGGLKAVAETDMELSGGEGVAFPDSRLPIPAIGERDERLIRFSAKEDINWLSLSFVSSRSDILHTREILIDEGSSIPIIAKIERGEAVAELDGIVEVADAVMVARGDLGLSVGLNEVPLLQKRIIKTAVAADKLSIVATQMLESMLDNPLPTRAEVSDVANAVIDGADALLLSGETAVGEYPVQTVRRLTRIIERTEVETDLLRRPPSRLSCDAPVADAVCAASVRAAEELNSPLICVFTATGRTPILLSRYYPDASIIACTDNPKTAEKLSLVRGVVPLLLNKFTDMEKMCREAEERILQEGFAEEDDVVVFVSGTPIGLAGGTDTLHIRLLKRTQ